jgi:hypothetical protein
VSLSLKRKPRGPTHVAKPVLPLRGRLQADILFSREFKSCSAASTPKSIRDSTTPAPQTVLSAPIPPTGEGLDTKEDASQSFRAYPGSHISVSRLQLRESPLSSPNSLQAGRPAMIKDESRSVTHAPKTICFQSAPTQGAALRCTMLKSTASSRPRYDRETSQPA